MEYNVTNELLARDLMDYMAARRSQGPDWLTSALSYPPPAFAVADQQDWPAPQAYGGPGTGDRAALDGSGWDAGNKGGQDAPRTRYDIGRGRAALLGAMQGASAEFGDELAGGYAAGSMLGINARRPVGMALQSILGLARLGYEALRGQRSSATEAYERGRDQVRTDTETARQQYPGTYYTANIGAGFAVPTSRAAQAATLPVRMRRGAVAGGLFGGVSGVGSGETATDRALQGVIGATAGSVLGAGVGAAAPVVTDVSARAGRALANRLADALDALPPMTRGARNASHVRANRPQEVWDPPTDLPQRSIELDYPHGVPVDAAGQITHTIEGQPIRAQRVFGRTTKDGPEYSLQPGDHDFLANAFMRKKAVGRTTEGMEGNLGTSTFKLGRLTDISLDRDMHPLDWFKVYAHELGHAVDEFAGQLPTKGLSHELRAIYNTMNNPNRTPDGLRALPGRVITPKDFDYPSNKVPREYAVEAIRAYMANPNYIKSVAPRTAQAIREFVNAHPRLYRIVQFNSLVGAPAAVGLARTSDRAERGL